MYPVYKMEDFHGALGKAEYFWSDKSWDATLKKSLYLWSVFLRDRDTSFRQSQRESQTLNIISHVFGIAQISVDASILQRGKEERKARLWRVVAKAEGGLFHTRNYDYEQGEGYHAFRYSGPLFCSGFLRERE